MGLTEFQTFPFSGSVISRRAFLQDEMEYIALPDFDASNMTYSMNLYKYDNSLGQFVFHTS